MVNSNTPGNWRPNNEYHGYNKMSFNDPILAKAMPLFIGEDTEQAKFSAQKQKKTSNLVRSGMFELNTPNINMNIKQLNLQRNEEQIHEMGDICSNNTLASIKVILDGYQQSSFPFGLYINFDRTLLICVRSNYYQGCVYDRHKPFMT
eukprot:GAHX01003495.1.p1 GENE.GAHX01003495.1~~GAHX01003495.1.p1  ORF type:complete len:163 (+),score=14.78 GAHX01003495.1:47-490(+)